MRMRRFLEGNCEEVCGEVVVLQKLLKKDCCSLENSCDCWRISYLESAIMLSS
ncbi:6811_t:CDS:2 [Dentiscutata erythropus]|uniref:6811_t:CDS:1 n=1 Tax=Dentiscutata erythropus TaxID=1348616 RepID=A0A9N8WIW7_9GLOM|nr:6811_t:CDS:2 [Dentiscutata erythropus]